MHKILSVGKHHTMYSVPSHEHSFWELVYTTSGGGKFFSKNGVSAEYAADEVVCIPPMREHSNTGKDGFTNIYLIMDAIALPSKNFIKISDNPSKILRGIFSQIHYFFNSDFKYKHDVLASLGDLLANCLMHFLDTVPQYSPLVEKMRSDIIKNFSDPEFSLSQTLDNKCNSPEYARKLFKKEIGKSPVQFLLELRLNNAARLLQNKHIFNINIAETAYQCGFNDAFYFSRIFKQHMGCSPKTYSERFLTD
ncbi:MAG: helix-turn-helix domain-containing protein [Clostridiales bacterium]|jgi:AraC-like DNA-binding protein|nr:helix-turn-helix domain-containing protein [Clostridiales bacterium]